MKTFGIYLAYPPGVDLRGQGLGRQLAEFLKQADRRADVRFVIGCPSWMRTLLEDLFREAGIQSGTFEIIGPKDTPILLALYELYSSWRRRARKPSRSRLLGVRVRLRALVGRLERSLAATHSWTAFAGLIVPAMALFALRAVARLATAIGRIRHRLRTAIAKPFAAIAARVVRPQDDPFIVRLYRLMEASESGLLIQEINQRRDVLAWYSPTAFWPQFNQIDAPKLTCVPDVVLSEFPVGFSAVNGDRFIEVFELVEEAIRGGENFVTYSHFIKNNTLVDRYNIPSQRITVVPHGANRMDDAISISNWEDAGAATRVLCSELFRLALSKSARPIVGRGFQDGNVKFMFYASQFRPNKNVISLLRAYDHLLRRRFIGHKLVLTGDPRQFVEIARFVADHNLENDVMFLRGLSDQQLAACYKLADLAVNPSLSEGGCPFTLTEALSVGTPVVMARIAVTEEVVTDAHLQSLMLFDPFDWRDIAARIEWALDNRSQLLEAQLAFYEVLSTRTWRNVVDEHIDILNRISQPATRANGASGAFA